MSDASEHARITRRGLLRGFAGAGAAGLLGGSTAVASAPGAQPLVFSRWVGTMAGRSGELAAPHPFALAGVEWAAPRATRIELRARARGGAWSPWGVASTLGHGPAKATSEVSIGEAVWTGPADFVELRSSRPLRGVRLHFVDVGTMSAASAAAAPALAQPVLDAGPGQPAVIARSSWAAGHAPPAVVPGYGRVTMAFVHHSDSLNGYSSAEVPSIIRGMYVYHRFVHGWNDIGYNFLIDLYGRIWEGRLGGIDQAVVGAQAGGYNLESTGVAMIGTFSGALPSPAALDSLEHVLAWKLSLHGVPTHGHVTVVVSASGAAYTAFRPGQHVSLPRVAGHRDGCTTDCPGNALYARLPAIRARIDALAGKPARVTLLAPKAPGSATTPIQVVGRLTDLSGAPIAGAQIEVQRFSATLRGTRATTLATASTAADGTFGAAVPVTQYTLVRALHRAAPAAVSGLVGIEVAPAITLATPSTTPLTVTGTVRPPTKAATVTLFAVAPDGHWQPLKRRRVAVKHGAFATTFAFLTAGQYGLSVHTPADAVSAPGASAPLSVTVP